MGGCVFKRIIPTLILVIIFGVKSFAGGFQINEHGAKAMAMAGAFTGLANDASAAYFNPAGITQLTGTHFMAGATFIVPSTSYTDAGWFNKTTTDMEDKIYYPINFYITQQLSEKLYVGLSVNNPYGLGTNWAADWPGRFIAFESDMQTFFINPVVAYKVSDAFSIAIGGVFAYGSVTISQKSLLGVNADYSTIDATTTLDGDGTAFGFTAAVLFTPSENFQWGFSYRSETKLEFEGTATTTPASIPMTIPGLGTVDYPLPNGAIVAKFTTPWTAQFGFAIKTSDKFTLTADAQLTGWSSFDTLSVDFNEYNSVAIDPTSPLLKIREPKKYTNNYIFRVGGEYLYSENFAIRGGILYDFQPSPSKYVDPSLPDADDWGFTIGFGYKITPNLTLDLGYMFLYYPTRTVDDSEVETGYPSPLPWAGTANGKYETTAHLFAIDFSYSF